MRWSSFVSIACLRFLYHSFVYLLEFSLCLFRHLSGSNPALWQRYISATGRGWEGWFRFRRMINRHKSIGIGRLGYDFHVHVFPFLLRLVLKTKRTERLYLMYEKNEEAGIVEVFVHETDEQKHSEQRDVVQGAARG